MGRRVHRERSARHSPSRTDRTTTEHCSRISRSASVSFVFVVLTSATLLAADVTVAPSRVELVGPEATQQLLVTATNSDRTTDVTRAVTYEIADRNIAEIDARGRAIARGDGETVVTVRSEDAEHVVPIRVSEFREPRPISFEHEIIPILSKSGCNAGGCHGKAEGQNGFKLSVFGFDAQADFDAVSKEGRGRRVMAATPESSLLLKKATGDMPHGGGRKLNHGGKWYRRMHRWIQEGCRWSDDASAKVASIEIEPSTVVVMSDGQQQLRVTAVDASGRRRCVTGEAEYQSNMEVIAGVDRRGLVTVSDVPGEAAILVRYMGHVGVCRVTLPRDGVTFPRPAENNFVDKHVWDKLEQLGVAPSETSDDATFLRRVFLDTIGTLPTVEEARSFLTSDSPTKRADLINALLQRDEYADYWAMRWSDLLRVDKDKLTPRGAVAMTRWLRHQFRENRPYKEFVTAILAARGSTVTESPAGFFQVHDSPQKLSEAVSQLFLGIRIECAQCHHHPFEHWSQRDYWGFTGLFTGVNRGGAPRGGQKILDVAGDDLTNPQTGEKVAAAGLGAQPAALTATHGRRDALISWLDGPGQTLLARTIVNRLWAHYLGRGLVEPIDDIRATNPASNEPLFDALAVYLVEKNYDLRALTRVILNSRTYQLSGRTTPSNEQDSQNYSRATWKALPAEVLLDAISQVTEVSEQFNGWPRGYRAIQVWDHRMPSYFFRIFGKPMRVTSCECERGNEPSIAQALHLMNAPESVRKIRHRDGRAARLAASKTSSAEIVDELYLAAFSRFPTAEERGLMVEAFVGSDRRSATEDILWALLNSKEFVYNH